VNDPAVCNALGDLYYATNGGGWTNRGGWASAAAGNATDYCGFWQFDSPTCSGGALTLLCVSGLLVMRRLTRLALRRARSWLSVNSLSGTIPSSLGSLTSLRELCVNARAARGGGA